MTKPTIRIHNSETNEILDREMTAAEFKIYELEQAKVIAEHAAAAKKENAKSALLERLGITAEEAALLLS